MVGRPRRSCRGHATLPQHQRDWEDKRARQSRRSCQQRPSISTWSGYSTPWKIGSSTYRGHVRCCGRKLTNLDAYSPNTKSNQESDEEAPLPYLSSREASKASNCHAIRRSKRFSTRPMHLGRHSSDHSAFLFLICWCSYRIHDRIHWKG